MKSTIQNLGQKLADAFMGRYSVQKTLRFELKPIGKTQEYIDQRGLREIDFRRSEEYKKVKKIIDRYHKTLIDEALQGVQIQGLEEYYKSYCKHSRDDTEEKQYKKMQENMRKQIIDALKRHPNYNKLFKKDLIEGVLPGFAADDEERELIEHFKGFTTYFTGFHENRKNMYSAEEKSTSISFRIIHQNLPKYMDNMRSFQKVMESDISAKLSVIQSEIGSEMEVSSIGEYFELSGFTKVLTQKGISIYNTILGGISTENGVKIKGLNEHINLYNQKPENQPKIPKLKPLFKQILSDKESVSFLPEAFESDMEVLHAVKSFFIETERIFFGDTGNIRLEELFQNMSEYDLGHIYINNDQSIQMISQELFGSWEVIRDILSADYDKKQLANHSKTKLNTESYLKKKKNFLNKVTYYSVRELDRLIAENGYEAEIEIYFRQKCSELIEKIFEAGKNCKILFEEEYQGNLKKDEKNISVLKEYLDAIKNLQRFMKMLLNHDAMGDSDLIFYAELERFSDSLMSFHALYNKVRNYVTQKPYSTEKFKLNFNKSTLLGGWDKNKERANLGIILEKNGLYYLGIMDSKDTGIFVNPPKAVSDFKYRKMNYKLLPGPNKMLPKVFFAKSGLEKYHPGEELLEKYNKGTHKKGENFSISDCHGLIDYFKESIEKNEDWKEFGFQFSDTETYEDISGFYREVEQQGYKITFEEIDGVYIEQLVNEGKLYLFQIYNKDFSEFSTGTPNLHTLYWKALFSEENLKNPVYKLNGEAEVFFRKHSIEENDIVCHPANEPIPKRNSEGENSMFLYDIIKDRRYTVDKYQFHVPITMNFGKSMTANMNQEVNVHIKYSDLSEVNVIGIDRGERNLLYVSVVGQDGKIKEQFSLNKIISCSKNGKELRTDYQKLLDKREKDREKAREDWKNIGQIKDLKEGYLSQAVHVIVELMIKYNAVIVMEDLNAGFKRGRQKIEKQIYQKFEKMLIEKLNYYVNKSKGFDENGGLYYAYQLTNRFESFEKLGKQTGMIYYIPAWMTSKIDPSTGFADLFYVKYKSVEETQKFIRKFDKMQFNAKEGYFEFWADYSKFGAVVGESRKDWVICSYGRRIEKFRNRKRENRWDARSINLTEEWMKLFQNYGINFTEGNLMEKVLAQTSADFYKCFVYLFRLTVQLRNSDSAENEDYIISPVKNKSGSFFSSKMKLKNRTEENNLENEEKIPEDADANGAYHIARKGWWLIEQFCNMEDDNLFKIPVLKNTEWLQYVQENPLNIENFYEENEN